MLQKTIELTIDKAKNNDGPQAQDVTADIHKDLEELMLIHRQGEIFFQRFKKNIEKTEERIMKKQESIKKYEARKSMKRQETLAKRDVKT